MDYLNKAGFYAAVRQDYNERRLEDQKNAFIYQYRKGLKDKKVSTGEYQRVKGNRRKDSYVFLRSCYESRIAGEIGNNEFFDVLKKLVSSIDVTKADLDYMLGEKDGNSKKEALPVKKKRLHTMLDSFKDISEEHVIRIYEFLCDKLIREDISTFFYNIGYDSDMSDVDELQTRGEGRSRNDEALDMLFEYEKFKARVVESVADKSRSVLNVLDKLTDDAFLRECNDLYDWLNQIQQFDGKDAFIPIIIDPESGLGIYIVGRTLLDPSEDYEDNCYYCCIRFEYGCYEEESFGEYCIKSGALSFKEFRENYKILNGYESGDLEMLRREYERGDRRFSMPYKVEGKHYRNIDGVIKAFCNLKMASRDLQGYDEVNEYLSDEIQKSNVIDNNFSKFFVEPDQKLRRAERASQKAADKELYKKMREKAARLERKNDE